MDLSLYNFFSWIVRQPTFVHVLMTVQMIIAVVVPVLIVLVRERRRAAQSRDEAILWSGIR